MKVKVRYVLMKHLQELLPKTAKPFACVPANEFGKFLVFFSVPKSGRKKQFLIYTRLLVKRVKMTKLSVYNIKYVKDNYS